jgi:hypothetical protein
MCAVGRMLLHVSTCAARSITPSQPSPIEGEGSKERRDASVNDNNSQARPSPGHYASCFCYEGCSSGEALPLQGGGLGGGDAAQLAGDRQMHAVAATSDHVGRRRFPRSTGPRGTQNRQCSGRSASGGGTCTPSFDASAGSARAAFPPRSCSGVKSGLGHVRRRPDASSCPEFCGGKHHPLPTLPHQGGGLQGEADAAPPVERAM